MTAVASDDSHSATDHALDLLDRLGLRPDTVLDRYRIVSIRSIRRGIHVEIEAQGHRFGIVLEPRDPARRCFASTASFNIVHEPLPEAVGREAIVCLRHFAHLMLERDPGGLDPRFNEAGLSVHVAHFETLFGHLPYADQPTVRSLSARLLALLRDGHLSPDFIEPSFTLGQRSFRIGVNATTRNRRPSERVPLTQQLLEMFELPGALDRGFLDDWLSDVEREVFLGIDVGNDGVRQKVYLRTKSPDTAALLESARSLGLDCDTFASSALQILSLDYVAGRLTGHKLYAKTSCEEACAMNGHQLLVPFLKEMGLLSPELTFYHSFRLAREERLGAALYAEFPTPVPASVAFSYASRANDPESERFFRELVQAVPLSVSTLSETLHKGAPRHVYLTLLKR